MQGRPMLDGDGVSSGGGCSDCILPLLGGIVTPLSPLLFIIVVICWWDPDHCPALPPDVRLANSLVRESHVCICKIFCICKEGYHPLWRDLIESAPSAGTIKRSSPNIWLGCWTESGCVKIVRERRIPCNPLAMLGSEAARYVSRIITFFLFTYLIVTPDRLGRPGRLSTPALDIPMLSLDIARSCFDTACSTPHSHTQLTMRDLYVNLHFEYLSSGSYSMYFSLELTLIYTETIASFLADN